MTSARNLATIVAIAVLTLALAACSDDTSQVSRTPPPNEAAVTTLTPMPTMTPTATVTATLTPIPTAVPTTATTPTATAPSTRAPIPTVAPAPTTTPTAIAPTVTRTQIPALATADGYLVSAPAAMRAGMSEGVAVSLFDGAAPARGEVTLRLTRGGATVAQARQTVNGAETIPLDIPTDADGSYDLEVEGPGFSDSAKLNVVDGTIIFAETDKPIYKPGQLLRVRALRLNAELKPAPGDVEFEIKDAKGLKIFKRTVESDDYGMAQIEMPLSTEPNLGVWKITASYGDRSAQTDARVERYALPKYEVNVNLPRDWALANEPITGEIAAEYSFGKPVSGEVSVEAYRYVGEWERYAEFNAEIDGETKFELPPVGYVAGVPAAGGQGNVRLEVAVTERATGYAEKTTRLLTIAESAVVPRLIFDSASFKPGLPLSALLITESPGNDPLDRAVNVQIQQLNEDLEVTRNEIQIVNTVSGKALFSVATRENAVAMRVIARVDDVTEVRTLRASHSPTDSFIHVEQTSPAALGVGDTAAFKVHSTRSARAGRSTYYEVVSRGRVVFSDYTPWDEIEFTASSEMAPSSRLVVYRIMDGSEVAADYIPFNVSGQYPMETSIELESDEAKPGESVNIGVKTQGAAKVGLAAVDRSVFILAENRLNLQQVFAELERLYMKPQVEVHDYYYPEVVTTRGAAETFDEAGLVVMTNKKAPSGETYEREMAVMMMQAAAPAAVVLESEAAPAPASQDVGDDLAEVQRVRQFFPETWLWQDLETDANGDATIAATAPDSITTWMLRAVSLSKEHGLGVAEAEMRVFQPFFVSVDLPYSAVRGEEFPVKVALYNYLDAEQTFFVELADSDDYALLDSAEKSVTVAGSDVGGVEFSVRMTELGDVPIEITARSADAADAVIKPIIVEPEGVSNEFVENVILSAGDGETFTIKPPPGAVDGSARTIVAISGSYLSQSIEGLENLLRMPYGCGEQNMILFAPNVFVARYLEETGQLKPEIMAKAEHLMTTGYQRELIYRRADGSFSAFGDSDESGSLWLTAFVLKTFAQAEGLIYMDDAVLSDAANWIADQQRPDGSFAPVGFLHHQELLGGLRGNAALTAYVAIALLEADQTARAKSAIAYLEGQADSIEDSYGMAITAYALALAGSDKSDDAQRRLTAMARQSDDGIYWSDDDAVGPIPYQSDALPLGVRVPNSASVETTGYAILALLEGGDRLTASSAARWLVTQRNSSGGFGSTQDTVVGLQALIEFAVNARFDVDMDVALSAGAWSKTISVSASNADVVQIVEVPNGDVLSAAADGSGEVVMQVVNRFNMPEVPTVGEDVFTIDVTYSADSIEVNDRITITADAAFNPPTLPGPFGPSTPPNAGMVVIDIAVPTGFAAVADTVANLVEDMPKLKRYDVAGRKVILYVEDMAPNESISLEFEAVALHPVKAQPVTSQVYSYYTPDWRGETLGAAVEVASQ